MEQYYKELLESYKNCHSIMKDNYLDFCKTYNLNPDSSRSKELDSMAWVDNDFLCIFDTEKKM